MANTQTDVSAIPRTEPQVCVFLLQLGGPKTLDDIRPFLRNLFEDVLPLPRWLRRPLAAFIAWRRTPEVRPLYQEIGGGSPLLANTEAQRDALEARLAALGVEAKVIIAMRYAPPRVDDGLAYARAHLKDVPWVALSLFPQYSFATSRSSLREMEEHLQGDERQRVRAICAYPEQGLYLDALARGIEDTLGLQPADVQRDMHLVFSAHGLPMKLVREGDPYPEHIEQTVAGVLQRLRVPIAGHTLCYQSRVGPVKWLEPSTVATLEGLGARGIKHVTVVPVAFTSEHIETLHEIDIQLRETALAAGVVTYLRAPTTGTHPAFIDGLAQLVLARLHDPKRCCGLYLGCELGQTRGSLFGGNMIDVQGGATGPGALRRKCYNEETFADFLPVEKVPVKDLFISASGHAMTCEELVTWLLIKRAWINPLHPAPFTPEDVAAIRAWKHPQIARLAELDRAAAACLASARNARRAGDEELARDYRRQAATLAPYHLRLDAFDLWVPLIKMPRRRRFIACARGPVGSARALGLAPTFLWGAGARDASRAAWGLGSPGACTSGTAP